MTKDNIFYSIIALLLGLIVGFMVANSINRSWALPTQGPAAAAGSQDLPPGHPSVPTGGATADQPDPQAMEAVRAAVSLAKNEASNFDAQMKAAELSYSVQRYEQAIEFLKRANQLRPDDYETVVALGNAYFDAEAYEDAEKWYAAALVQKPDEVNVRTDLGLTFMFRKSPDLGRAIQEFRRSLELNPNHMQTLQNMTVALTRSGRAEEAQATLDKLEAVNPNNPALQTLRTDLEKLRSSAESKQASGKTAAGKS
jgi:tetratricopeptide (TPR) repeat protein